MDLSALPQFQRSYLHAYSRSVPLVAVRTPDQPSAYGSIVEAVTRKAEADGTDAPAIVQLDPVRGMTGTNDAGRQAVAAMCKDIDPSMATDPTTALGILQQAPPDTIAIAYGGDRWLAEPRPAIAALLLRDPFARRGCMFVALGATWTPARELGQDVYVIDDPRPDDQQRRTIGKRIVTDRKLEWTAEVEADVDRYGRGLPPFVLEQLVTLSCNGAGVKRSTLASRWVEAINAVPGLSVVSTGEPTTTGEVLIGLDAWQRYARTIMGGRLRPDVILWIDEIEKAYAGTSGGSQDGGVSANVLRATLRGFDTIKGRGAILLGAPGSGKSLASRMLGLLAQVPVLSLDLDATKEGLVGASEARIRQVFETLETMTREERCYFVGTANTLEGLRPELKRRFKGGIWFVDLPARKARVAMWEHYYGRFELTGAIPSEDQDAGFSGADIAACCEQAWEGNGTVADVLADGYVPASAEAIDDLEVLRRRAAGRMRSADYPGKYRMPSTTPATTAADAPRRRTRGE